MTLTRVQPFLFGGQTELMLSQLDGTGMMVAGHRFGDARGPAHTLPLLEWLLALPGFNGRTTTTLGASNHDQRGMVECDGYLSLDGTVWCSHEDISAMTDAQIEADLMPLENGMGPARRMMWTEVLAATVGHVILMETKSDGVVAQTLSDAISAGRRGDVIINSYEPARVNTAIAQGFFGSWQYLAGAAPSTAAMDAAVTAGVRALTVDESDATATFCGQAHSRGLIVAAYTVSGAGEYQTMHTAGVDVAISNIPDSNLAL